MYRVVFFSRSGRLYGDNKALLNIFDGFKGFGIKPIVVVSESGPFLAELENRNIEYIQVKYSFNIYPNINNGIRDIVLYLPRLLRMFYFNRKAFKSLQEKLRFIKPDIIHTNVGPIDLGFKLAEKFNIPHIWHLREYQDLDFDMSIFPSKEVFLRRLKRSYAITITNGVLKHFNLDQRKSPFNSKVIYDGVLSKSETRDYYSGIKRNYLFVGRIEEAKGIDLLIDAIGILKNKEGISVNLDIAGEGNLTYVSNLKQKIREQNLEDNINFLGYRTDIGILMNEAKALIVPSRYEGFGFITVEAMFNNCLVIGRNTGGTKEILEFNNLGLLFNDQQELVDKIREVEQNGSNYFKLRILDAHSEATKLYSKERNIEQILEFYKEILNEKQG